jgi:hypothetical protein
MRALVAFAVACLALLTAGPAAAHSGSYDMKYVDGSNLILVTFNTHQPVSGLDIEHNIRLYDLVGAPIPYDEVHVEVHTRSNTEGAAGLEPSLRSEETLPMLPTNESKMTYAYPVSGSYTLKTIFFAQGREISRGEFAIDVGKGSDGPSRGVGVWGLAAAFLLGGAVTMLFRRRGPARQAVVHPSAAATTDDGGVLLADEDTRATSSPGRAP